MIHGWQKQLIAAEAQIHHHQRARVELATRKVRLFLHDALFARHEMISDQDATLWREIRGGPEESQSPIYPFRILKALGTWWRSIFALSYLVLTQNVWVVRGFP